MSTDKFVNRHNGPRENEVKEMLKKIGVSSVKELIEQTVPSAIRLKAPLATGEALSEHQYLKHLKAAGKKNKVFRSYIGLGYYNNILPAVIQRNILENPGWYTAYTPYQAEIAQGRLEALLNFQTMVMDLTAMPIANASLLDEATAAGEAAFMFYSNRSRDKQKNNANKLLVSSSIFPQVIDVVQTRCSPVGIEVVIGDVDSAKLDETYFGVLLQYPDINGEIKDYKGFSEKCKAMEIQIGVGTDLLSLASIVPPGEWGADVVYGNSQRFGVPLGYGGPHAAFFACKEDYKRLIPGRIIGVSIDAEGNQALRMALQTREQHIKRDKATSNICTAQALLAIMASMYAVYHGKDGIKAISEQVHGNTAFVASELKKLGFEIKTKLYFDTLVVVADSKKLKSLAEAKEINFRYIDDKHVAFSIDQTVEEEDVNDILNVFAGLAGKTYSGKYTQQNILKGTFAERKSPYLTHPVFNTYHSESDMMRYIKRLENKDLSLVHSMISLGSCTMKLNAASELLPLTWAEFAHIHPFVPVEQAQGYAEIINTLDKDLSNITGFAKMSFQPNSGAQGEYAGLMVIRQYHIANNGAHRTVALIPQSAHGTNPASAAMAGMDIVIVKCDAKGNVDIADLKAKAEQHKANLSCIMITYPSTHGVYEEGITEITKIIHDNGGLVYMDGANMNAQVGLTSPGNIGADVCHLNLHKTFAIPHGGGGPGMGPIGVVEKLVPYLPTHPIINTGGAKGIQAVSSAPFGSALILLISYGYIKMLGADGLKSATETAILNANYMKEILKDHYKILYTGTNNRCAHEMILDCSDFKMASNVEVADIAKRLMDYGFHAPTVAFPVVNTLMVEPTESESKAELDRFCEAMINIRKEIQEIIDGKADKVNNVIKNAPHTAKLIISDKYDKPYGREKAAFPLPWVKANKFWPSVARVDNAYGDRHLVCSCAPIEDYMTEGAEA
ncbi:MAG: aminomethyl-transferring glycine dehydrogenase [Sphingobacteriaceae bacterium]|nr:aminomethyl-transferring glycine dehydrogenase [Sphingobacteriaceae bacterium]